MRRGQVLDHRWLNRLVDAANRFNQMTVVGGRWSPGAAVLDVSGWQLTLAVTPAGGIPARSGATMGAAECVRVADDHRSLRRSEPLKVLNWAGSAIGGGRLVMVAMLGHYGLVVSEDCSGAPFTLSTGAFSTGFSPGFDREATATGTGNGWDAGFSSGFGPTPPPPPDEVVDFWHTGGPPTAGHFWLTLDGTDIGSVAGPDIPYDVTAPAFQALLEAHPSIGAGNVACTGGPFNSAAIRATFGGALAGTDVGAFTVGGTSFAFTGTPTVTVVQEGG